MPGGFARNFACNHSQNSGNSIFPDPSVFYVVIFAYWDRRLKTIKFSLLISRVGLSRCDTRACIVREIDEAVLKRIEAILSLPSRARVLLPETLSKGYRAPRRSSDRFRPSFRNQQQTAPKQTRAP